MKRLLKLGVILGLGSLFFLNALWLEAGARPQNRSSAQKSSGPKADAKDADRKIKEAYEAGKSNFWVQSQGRVIKVLKDDHDGSRHQRFLLRLSNGHSVLIAHNIDVAPRVERLKQGDVITFSGEYEWNNKGGVVHWTHRDPSGRKAGGWLEYNGRRYE